MSPGARRSRRVQFSARTTTHPVVGRAHCGGLVVTHPHIQITSHADGDFTDVTRFGADTTWLRQVHGSTVVTVTHPGEHAGAEADAAITRAPNAKLAVRTADCVPIVLEGDGVIGVVHAGWRGLAAGIVRATVAAMGGAHRA